MGHTENPYRNIPYRRSAPSSSSSSSSRFESSTPRKAWLVASVQSWNFNRQWKYKPEKLGYPICCMEYLPTFARTKSPSHVGKYTSTTEHMDMEGIKVFESQGYRPTAHVRVKWK